MSEDYFSVADYVIDYGELKKVVPDEVKAFEEESDALLVALKLLGYSFETKHLIQFFNDKDSSVIEYNIDDSDYFELEEKFVQLQKLYQNIKDSFFEITGLHIWIEYSKAYENIYVAFREDEVVTLTPKAQKLKDSGVHIHFENWVEEV